ncbi:unnamed protein product, partial [Ascophyllum nodosum]
CAEDSHHNSGYSLLLLAAYHGKEDIVGWLLAASAGGDGLQERSMALQIACVMGRVGVVTALLADGTDPSPSASAKDSESRKPSAFEMAAKCGHVGVMRVLLQHHARGAWAECGDSARGIDNVLRTVMGSPNNTADVIDFLVNEAGADVKARNDHGDTLLHEAVLWDSLEAAVTLLRHGADVEAVNDKGDIPLLRGASEASCEAITALLLHGAEVDAADKKGKTPLVTAVEMGKLALVDALVAGGADVNRRNVVDDMAPLDVAAFIGNLGVLKALQGFGSRAKSVNSVGATALHRVAGFEAAGLVHALVDAGADVSAEDANGMAPIHYASISGSPTAIMALTQDGADSEARTRNGMTPLQVAAKCGNVSAIDALAAAGADINLRTTTEDTSALDLAAHAGEVDAMNALIRHGANVRAGNASGYTALYFVSDVNQAASIDFLAGADVHGLAQEWTPLDASCEAGAADAIATLAELGADLTRTNVNGLIPLQLAFNGGHLDAVNALLEAGADPNQEFGGKRVLYYSILRSRRDILASLLLHGADVN